MRFKKYDFHDIMRKFSIKLYQILEIFVIKNFFFNFDIFRILSIFLDFQDVFNFDKFLFLWIFSDTGPRATDLNSDQNIYSKA